MNQKNEFDLISVDAAGKATIHEFKRFIPPKSNFLHLINSIATTIAATANTAGGSLYIGVDEETGKPIGLKFADQNIKLLEKAVGEHLNLDPSTIRFKVLEEAGKKYIRIDISKQKGIVVRKTDGAIYEIKEGKEHQLSESDAEKKIISSVQSENTKSLMSALYESIANLNRELSATRKNQWKSILLSVFLTFLCSLWIFHLGNSKTVAIEKERVALEKTKMAIAAQPYLDVSFETSSNPGVGLRAKTVEAARVWKKLVSKNEFNGNLSRKIVTLNLTNYGKEKAIEVIVPITVKVWGIGPYTRDLPYQYDEEINFRNVQVGPEYKSEIGIDVTYYPRYRIEKKPMKVKGLPEVQYGKDLEMEVHSSLALESENNQLLSHA